MNVEQHMLPSPSVSGKMTLNHTHTKPDPPPTPPPSGVVYTGETTKLNCVKKGACLSKREKKGEIGIIISALCRESLYYLY